MIFELALMVCFAPPGYEATMSPCPIDRPWARYTEEVRSEEQCELRKRALTDEMHPPRLVVQLIAHWATIGLNPTPEHTVMVGWTCVQKQQGASIPAPLAHMRPVWRTFEE